MMQTKDSDFQDFSIVHHANMLADQNRLMSFKKAIKETVQNHENVVDIGTGTGILAAFSSLVTQQIVYAIEYFPFGIELATTLFQKNNLKNIQLINDASYNVTLSLSPDVLITETIGQIGPEENIVEICYDFCQRHPSIHSIIPAKLSVYAEFIHSKIGSNFIDNFINNYLQASSPEFDYQHIKPNLHRSFANLILQTDLSDAQSISSPILLAEYELGKTKDSSFRKEVTISPQYQDSLIHLYFVAELSPEIHLSTRFTESTHWKHSFFSVANGKELLQIQYKSGTQFITVNWLK